MSTCVGSIQSNAGWYLQFPEGVGKANLAVESYSGHASVRACKLGSAGTICHCHGMSAGPLVQLSTVQLREAPTMHTHEPLGQDMPFLSEPEAALNHMTQA